MSIDIFSPFVISTFRLASLKQRFTLSLNYDPLSGLFSVNLYTIRPTLLSVFNMFYAR